MELSHRPSPRVLLATALALVAGCAPRADDAHLRYPGEVRSHDVARGRGRFVAVCVTSSDATSGDEVVESRPTVPTYVE